MKLPKEFTLAEIAQLVGGVVTGEPGTKVGSVAMSPLSAREGDLALVFEPKLLRRLSECQAGAVIVPEGVKAPVPSIAVKRPLLALAKMLTAVGPPRFNPCPGVHETAVVDKTAEVAEGVAIGPNVVIGPGTRVGKGTTIAANCVIGGKVVIGENCLLHPGCLVADYVQIGNRVILQQGANLGSDGFGYVTERPSNMEKRLSGGGEPSDEPNPHVKIPQIGLVVLEDDVEIGANATIARGTMGATVIGAGSKIDNQVMIAHNVRIGREVLIVAHAGVAGSCVVGDRAILAGHVAVKDHINIGKDAIAEGTAGVMRDVADGEVVCGTPAIGARDFFKQIAVFRRGPEIASELKALKARLAELEKALSEKELVR